MRPDHPFTPWIFAAAATVAALAIGRAIAVEPALLWDQRIDRRIAEMQAQPDIAVIGTCVIQPVAGVSGELERDMAAAGRDVSVIRLLRPGRDWDWEPVVESLTARPPRIVVIEMPVLVRNRRPATPVSPGIVQSLQQVRSAALAVVFAAPRLPSLQDVREAWWRRDVATFETGTWPLANLDAAQIELAWATEFHEPSHRGMEALRGLARQSLGIVILDLPRHPDYPVPSALRDPVGRVSQSLQNAGLRVLAAPDVGGSGFFDTVHLNDAGARSIRAFLVRELLALLPPQAR